MSGGIALVVANPSDDAEFRDAIEGCVAGGVRGPAELEEYLRRRFPRAVVRRRELSGEAQATWYAYREGHWVAPAPSGREDAKRTDAVSKDRVEDLRSTQDEISREADRLSSIEDRKADATPGGPEVQRLSAEAVRSAERIRDLAHAEEQVAEEIRNEA